MNENWRALGLLIAIYVVPSLPLQAEDDALLEHIRAGSAEGFLAEWWWAGLLPLALLVLALGLLLWRRTRQGEPGPAEDRRATAGPAGPSSGPTTPATTCPSASTCRPTAPSPASSMAATWKPGCSRR